MDKIWIIYGFAINIITFFLYGLDKKKAQHNQWRISEKTLIGTALIGGSLGAFCGMYMFRHKTKHWKFRICIPLFLLIHILFLLKITGIMDIF